MKFIRQNKRLIRNELYDHRKDKYEWKNVASKKKYQKVKAQLKQEMFDIIGESVPQ
ncbi:hypothetical protein KMW28_22645 [Flammeovirga yaeyamensis]|uniref:Uncharacterized protein n=1 Tax=Flammeovirga yaeyamensis TaxID=367791 RepID=A0AAX1NCH7_9BACT|nr:sulfatase/phosphatase domain-containing protein [Flammeovirga yaeyamensis]MBB3696839.1 hypothetical protein [Flammeovirga yaeyamensis]NMF33504.1 hypothetical protein [Flammeovirga yaeyamensis]QWG05224.1 hypothetical protein KMW28_22645 [Flammeovirga yaeyamensis]